MHILVYGSGAVGGYLGGYLAAAGEQVMLLMRPEGAARVQAQGLTLVGPEPDRRIQAQPQAATSLATALEAAASPPDLILLTMKAYDMAPALLALADRLPQPPPVICFQNGIGVEEEARTALPTATVVAGVVTTPLRMNGEGSVMIERAGRGLALAPTTDGDDARPWVYLFRRAGLTTQLLADYRTLKWSKALLNSLANATSALLNWSPAQIYQHTGLFNLEMDMVSETLRVMAGLKLHPVDLPGAPAALLAMAVRRLPRWALKPILTHQVGGGRGQKMPSFHMDLSIGRKSSEVIYHNGAVARAGQTLNLSAPVNHALTDLLMQAVQGIAPRDRYFNRPEELLAATAGYR